MNDYRRDLSIDDRQLTAREAAQIWRRCPERLRYYYVLTLPEALADAVLTLTATTLQKQPRKDTK